MYLDGVDEITSTLREGYTKYKAIFRKLVIKRIKHTSFNGFRITEIYYWSNYFNINMPEFLFEVLMISQQDYMKIRFNRISIVNSDRYSEYKKYIINIKKEKYLKTINLNVKNYYNRDKLINEASNIGLNVIDFSKLVLGKSMKLIRRVLNSKDSTTRLFIGEYKNEKLSNKYILENFENINFILSNSLKHAQNKLGVSISKEEFEDNISDGILFLLEKGNNLDIDNELIIKDWDFEFKEKHRKMLSSKVYYFFINNLKEYISEKNKIELNENYLYLKEENFEIDNKLNSYEIAILERILKLGNNEDSIKLIAKEKEKTIEYIYDIIKKARDIYDNKD